MVSWLIVWEVWFGRNKSHSENISSSAESICEKVDKWIVELLPGLKPKISMDGYQKLLMERFGSTDQNGSCLQLKIIKWNFPPPGVVKINVSARRNEESGYNGAYVVRNHKGDLKAAFGQSFGASLPGVVEVSIVDRWLAGSMDQSSTTSCIK